MNIKKMIYIILAILVIILIALFIMGISRTWEVQHNLQQTSFLRGTVPAPRPNGFYHGTVSGRELSWLGKSFNIQQSVGVNILNDGSGMQNEKYPFKTYVGKGIADKNLDVLKIDYNIKGNPLWLRVIVDEIVQTGPGQYLGKVHLKIIPGIPFTVGFFELKK